MLGFVLKEVRETYGLTQVKLADKIGVTQGQVSRWEKSGRAPVKIVPILASALGLHGPSIYGRLWEIQEEERAKELAAGFDL